MQKPSDLKQYDENRSYELIFKKMFEDQKINQQNMLEGIFFFTCDAVDGEIGYYPKQKTFVFHRNFSSVARIVRLDDKLMEFIKTKLKGLGWDFNYKSDTYILKPLQTQTKVNKMEKNNEKSK